MTTFVAIGPDHQASLDRVRSAVREHGLRWSSNRAGVVRVLVEAGGHMSASEVHAALAVRSRSIQLSIVHRVLNALVEESLVHVLGQAGEPRYGLVLPEHHQRRLRRLWHDVGSSSRALDEARARASRENRLPAQPYRTDPDRNMP